MEEGLRMETRQNNMRKFINLEIVGIFFTYFLGLFLKYSCIIFNWEVWTLIFGAVNQSTWEEIKVFTLPYVIWSGVEFCTYQISFKRFVVAKTLGLYSILILFISEFALCSIYYDVIPNLFRIIVEGLVCISIYFISYKILNKNFYIGDIFVLSIFLDILFISMYLSFTINPPHLNVFKDMTLNLFGIPL